MDEQMNWTKFLSPVIGDINETGKFAVIILNHCFDNLLKNPNDFFESSQYQKFQQCWNEASIRISVDGGTNYLRDFQKSNKNLKDPSFVTGDFDSIRKDVLEHFHNKPETTVVQTPDQMYTDFEKSFSVLKTDPASSLDCVLVFYTNFSRIDQYLSILSTAHRQARNPNVPPLIMIDLTGSISMVLNPKPVLHSIPRLPGSWCSLVPLCGPTTLTTTGFRWDLNNEALNFGEFISTSNEFDPENDIVTVICDKQILFSAQFDF